MISPGVRGSSYLGIVRLYKLYLNSTTKAKSMSTFIMGPKSQLYQKKLKQLIVIPTCHSKTTEKNEAAHGSWKFVGSSHFTFHPFFCLTIYFL